MSKNEEREDENKRPEEKDNPYDPLRDVEQQIDQALRGSQDKESE